jgi:hypothetical protein
VIPGDPRKLSMETSSPGADAGAGIEPIATAICPRCDREQTMNTAATALTEVHYCLCCRQSFLVHKSSTERAAGPRTIPQQDLSCQARHPAVPVPQPCVSWSDHTGTCHWFWQYPGLVVGGLGLSSLLLYAWRLL